MVADGRVVWNLAERNRDLGAFMERRVNFVEDAERRLRCGLVSVLSHRAEGISHDQIA